MTIFSKNPNHLPEVIRHNDISYRHRFGGASPTLHLLRFGEATYTEVFTATTQLQRKSEFSNILHKVVKAKS